MDHFERSLDGVDAAIFTGDSLCFKEKQELFKNMLDRWNRRLEEMKETDWDNLDEEEE